MIYFKLKNNPQENNNLIKPIPQNVLEYYVHNIFSPLKVLKYMLQNKL